MRILSLVSCILLTTLILGCDSVAPSAPDYASATESTDSFAAKKTVKLVPFKGSLTGFPGEVIIPVDCGPVVTVPITLAGNLTHFGLSTLTGTHCGDILTFPNITLFGGKGIIRAANGDEVFIDYGGTLDASPVCGVPHVFELTGTITDGTGRFDGASGEVTFTGTQVQPFCPPDSDPPPGFTEVVVDGQLSSVGSSGN